MSRHSSVLVAGLVLLGVAACESGQPTAPPAPAAPTPAPVPTGPITVVAQDFKFLPDHYTVRHGTVTFVLVNQGKVPHNMVVLDQDGDSLGKSPVVQPGQAATFDVPDLNVGEDNIKDTLPGHDYQAEGMVADLLVV